MKKYLIDRKRFSYEVLKKIKFHYPCLAHDEDFSHQFNFFLEWYFYKGLISLKDFWTWEISEKEILNLRSHYRDFEIKDLKKLI